jgi:hypothetical protein
MNSLALTEDQFHKHCGVFGQDSPILVAEGLRFNWNVRPHAVTLKYLVTRRNAHYPDLGVRD